MTLVLSLFDRTGVMVKPWADSGYECVCVDIRHEGERLEDGIRFVGRDVLHYIPADVPRAITFAFPPCTHLAVSGARWFKDKGLRCLIESLELVERARKICEASASPWMIENPIGSLSTYWREPDSIFDPYEYGGYSDPPGDAYTKKTCLWFGNGFRLPPKRRVTVTDGSRMHLMSPSPERADLRSVTPAGFAAAVFAANHVEST